MESTRQRRIRCKANIQKHLKQMNYLCTTSVEENTLLSIEKTDEIFEEYKVLFKIKKAKKTVFKNKENIIEKIIGKLLLFDCECYIISEFSFDSGLLIIPSLNFFNSSFNFDTLDFDRVTLLSTNFSNKITFWEESDDIIEIEITGHEWIDALKDLDEI